MRPYTSRLRTRRFVCSAPTEVAASDPTPLPAEPRSETVDLERPLRGQMLRPGLTQMDVGRIREKAAGDHRRRPGTELEEAGTLAGERRGGHPAGESGGD